MNTSLAGQYVGPYRLEKTLGRGQTGKLRLLYKSYLLPEHLMSEFVSRFYRGGQ